MRRITSLLIAAGCTAALMMAATAGIAAAHGGWKVVKHKSARGDFAVTAVNATIHHPRRIAVRLRGGSGLVTWACNHGFTTSSWSHRFQPGMHRLGHVAGKELCDVTASVGGRHHVVVQILTRR